MKNKETLYVIIHKYKGIEEESFEDSIKWAAKLIDMGYLVLPPISFTHIINKRTQTKVNWYEYDFKIYEKLRKSKNLAFLIAENWSSSFGCKEEIKWANKNHVDYFNLFGLMNANKLVKMHVEETRYECFYIDYKYPVGYYIFNDKSRKAVYKKQSKIKRFIIKLLFKIEYEIEK